MLNFAEQTGSGAVMLVWSFLQGEGRTKDKITKATQQQTKLNILNQLT